MLVTNYNQYLGQKLKDSKEFILSSRLIKDTKLRKHKTLITEYKKLYVKAYLVLQQGWRNFWKIPELR